MFLHFLRLESEYENGEIIFFNGSFVHALRQNSVNMAVFLLWRFKTLYIIQYQLFWLQHAKKHRKENAKR